MFDIYQSASKPAYLDQTAEGLLHEARNSFARYDFAASLITQTGQFTYIVSTRCGTVKTTNLAMALSASGFEGAQHDGFLLIDANGVNISLHQALAQIPAQTLKTCF